MTGSDIVWTNPIRGEDPYDVDLNALHDTFGNAINTLSGGTIALPGRRYLRAALGARYLAPVRAVFIGSSTTQGYNATTRNRRYVDRLGLLLHAKYSVSGVVGGYHVMAADADWSYTGTHGTNADGFGLQSSTLSAAATMVATFNPSTAFTVHFAQGPGQGSFAVKVDSGTPVTVTPNTTGSYRHDGTYTTPSVSVGSHVLTITATGACVINGAYIHNGDETTGVQVYCCGKSGSYTSDMAANAPIFNRIGQLAPALVAIMPAANDYADGVTPAATKAALLSIIANARAASTTAARPFFLLIGTYRRLDVSTAAAAYPWSAYLQVMADVAAADGMVEFVDISGLYPQSQMVDAWDVIDNADSIHQTDRGHGMMADILLDALTTPAAAPNASLVPVGTITPDVLSGLLAWWKADALGLVDGNPVSSWATSGGQETAPLTQTGTNRPTYKAARINGLPSVLFAAASSQSMDTGTWGLTHSTPITTFCVFRYTTVNGNLHSGRSGVYTYIGPDSSGGNGIAIGAGNANEVTTIEALDAGAVHVIAAVYNGASSSIRVDTHLPTRVGTTTTGGSSALPGVHMGTNSSASGSYLDGEIAEMVIYGRALADSEISQVLDYLAGRYGLTVL